MVALLQLAACTGWPLFANTPADTGTGRDPADRDGIELTDWVWSDAPSPPEPENDTPADAPSEAIDEGEGHLLASNLEGIGWDAEDAARDACDGHVANFPPTEVGAYAGDLDWRIVDLSAAGVLCSRLEAVDEDVRVDVLAYTLDTCGLPAVPLREPDGVVLGFATESTLNAWFTSIAGPTRLALVAAGYAPDSPGGTYAYQWGLAVVSQVDAQNGIACPELPHP